MALNPKTKLKLEDIRADGRVETKEINDFDCALHRKSPDGRIWEITVTNAGALVPVDTGETD